MNSILQKTMYVCMDEQWMCAVCAYAAVNARARGDIDTACAYQIEAAYHHEEMAMRLDRIIGVA